DVMGKKPDSAQSAIVFLPKSKALIDMTLAFVSGIVVSGGTIVLAGTKKGGIESAKKWYETNIGPVDQKIVGNHSALYVGKNQKLGADKKLEDFLSYFPVTFKDTTLEIANLPGVFSAREFDAGTKLLLEHIPFNAKTVLDVGCGGGVIGSIYKKLSPSTTVTMADISQLAVRATQETLKKNNLEATVLESNVFSNITGTFDVILCNPPFHTGIETDYTFMERFAEGARKHLGHGGTVYIVANSFLSYQPTLEKIGPTEIIVDNNKFRVFKTTV
ncbi:MAG: ribosomal small subunit methyltransferase rRNA m2G120 methyltransferase, partial [Candidatus Parcubacteria bacterium]